MTAVMRRLRQVRPTIRAGVQPTGCDEMPRWKNIFPHEYPFPSSRHTGCNEGPASSDAGLATRRNRKGEVMRSIQVSRPAVLAQAVTLALAFCGNVSAQQPVSAGAPAGSSPQIKMESVSIPAQPVEAALDAFAAQTGLQVVYSGRGAVRNLQSPGLPVRRRRMRSCASCCLHRTWSPSSSTTARWPCVRGAPPPPPPEARRPLPRWLLGQAAT